MTDIADITPEWVEAYLIEMVQTNAAIPDPERRFRRGLVSGHPAIGADWETHMGHADKPIDPVTGLPDTSVPKMRPAYPSAAQIDRAEMAAGWLPLVKKLEHSIVLRCVLIVKARGSYTIWPPARHMVEESIKRIPELRSLRERAPRYRRYSNSTMQRYYKAALNDIAAGIRADMADPSAQKAASKAARRISMVSRGVAGGKATQRAAQRKREVV